MSFLVVVLLSLLWLGFFLPSLLQARRTSSPYASANTFQASLRRLGEVPRPRSAAEAPAPRPTRRAAVLKARRRDTLAVLGAAVLAGGLIAVGFGGWATWAVLPPAVALVGYVVLLRRQVVRRTGQRHFAPAAPAARTDAGPAPHPVAAPVDQASADTAIVPSVARRSTVEPPERMAG